MDTPRPANDSPPARSDEPEWVTPAEAAAKTGCSAETIRRWIRDERIIARKSTGKRGGPREVRLDDVTDLLDQGTRHRTAPGRHTAEASRILVPGSRIVLLDEDPTADA